MVKFDDKVDRLNYKIVGRKKSVQREVNLLTKEWDGELTVIKKCMWTIKNRNFVSVYSGRRCVGTVFFVIMNKSKGYWELSNAVVHKDMRGCGIGGDLCRLAIDFVFQNGCKSIYLGAQCLEIEDDVYESAEQSRAYNFWKKLQFKRVSQDEYNRALRKKVFLMDYDWEGFIPMKLTKRSSGGRDIPDAEVSINKLFKKLSKVGKKNKDLKKNKKKKSMKVKRAAMVRLCNNTSEICVLSS